MKRRDFIALIGGVSVGLPHSAIAQQSGRIRRIGVLMNPDDPVAKARIAAFRQGLQKLGWNEGRNLKIEYRLTPGGGEDLRKYARDLIALAPEVIMVTGTPPVVAQREATRTIPIVLVSDPVPAGFVDSLARPGGNATGFTPFEYSTSAKWLELLKEIAPGVKRVAVMEEFDNPGAVGQVTAIRSAAQAFQVDITSFNGHDATEIERTITAFGRSLNGGLIIPAIPTANIHRDLLIALAARNLLPAVYGFRLHVAAGGLVSYGPDQLDQYQQAARSVDRILKGKKPAALPVQTPTKYELTINLKTAKPLGLNVPLILQQRADEVIE